MKYDEVEDGEWIFPAKRGYKMVCCDCGLVHRIDFDHVPCSRGRLVIFRVFRDNRATAAVRRWMKRKSNKPLSGPEPAAGDGYARKDSST